jgi:cbb3-type cytochrome oxidase maturation protein
MIWLILWALAVGQYDAADRQAQRVIDAVYSTEEERQEVFDFWMRVRHGQ